MLIAFGVVIIASIAQIWGAMIYKKEYKENRKEEEKKIKETREIEEKKIKSELIYKNKQVWVVEFRTLIYNLLIFLDKLKFNNDNIMYWNADLADTFHSYIVQLRLYLDSDNENHKKLLTHIHDLYETNHVDRNYHYMTVYISKINSISNLIIEEIMMEINNI